MTEPLIERARQLIQLNRYKDAENELRKALSSEPENAEALSLLALCLADNHVEEATVLIKNAISLEPDNDYFLYLHAFFLQKQEKYKEAEKLIYNAIAIQPLNAEYYGLLATIKLNQRDWEGALHEANKGLAVNPENLTCLNKRSTALFKLDRKEEAYQTIQEALNQDPENEYTHTNLGWGLLERGDPHKALEHFREALKINPNFEQAKSGLVEGLKSRYWFYRAFLQYAFWLSRLKAKAQWAVIFGLYFGVKILNSIADNNKDLALFIKPIVYAYFAFALSTWIITPLSNLFLRLNVYGRYALTRKDILVSNFTGILLLTAVLSGLLYFVTEDLLYVALLIFGFSMMIPLSSMLNPSSKKNQTILVAYTIALALVGLVGVFQLAVMGQVGIPATVYLIGIIAYQWVANALIMRN